MNVNKITKMKFIIFTFIAIFVFFVCAILLLFSVDLYLHRRYASSAGFNYRGYRGPVVKHKQRSELRIVVLGGSTVFGYGVSADETIPAYLQLLIDQRFKDNRHPVSVVNLGYNSEGAHSFKYTLQDYRYLDYDIAILYEGYNDLVIDNNSCVFRHNSAIFRLTGYLPILPLILREKVEAIRYGGNIEKAYRHKKTNFKPNLAQRTTATALEQVSIITQSLENQLGSLTKELEPDSIVSSCGCYQPWLYYCEGIARAIEYALSRNVYIIVVTQPYISDRHKDQQQAMVGMLKERFGNEPLVHYVNLGSGVIDLKDSTLCYDRMHLTAKGNEKIASYLLEQVMKVLEQLK